MSTAVTAQGRSESGMLYARDINEHGGRVQCLLARTENRQYCGGDSLSTEHGGHVEVSFSLQRRGRGGDVNQRIRQRCRVHKGQERLIR